MFPQKLPDDFYDRVKPQLYARIAGELRSAKRVFDVGCGGCELVRHLVSRNSQEVTGVDVSAGSFPAARRSPDGMAYRCIKGDAARMDFADDESADAVVMVWAMHEMPKPKRVLGEARRVLRPGGEILIVDFPRDSLAHKLWGENYYCPAQIKKLLENGLFGDVSVCLIHQEQVMWARGYRPLTTDT
jgi:ubiquinone/menaquinone biosynthesis C-methylase UbiE